MESPSKPCWICKEQKWNPTSCKVTCVWSDVPSLTCCRRPLWFCFFTRSHRLCHLTHGGTRQSKQFMTVKRGSVYDDKQHMLGCASWCNDVVMPDSLTSAHCLWWPFMTELIDSHMHQNRNNRNENAVGRRSPICHVTGGGKERWHLSRQCD